MEEVNIKKFQNAPTPKDVAFQRRHTAIILEGVRAQAADLETGHVMSNKNALRDKVVKRRQSLPLTKTDKATTNYDSKVCIIQ